MAIAPAAEDDLRRRQRLDATVGLDLDAGDATVLDEDAADERVGAEPQVAAARTSGVR